jgi:polyribonucleotide nucleotidyltransferase
MVIGKGGETIRSLESEYEVQIDIEEDGMILTTRPRAKGDAAIAAIGAHQEPEVGDQYTGRVVRRPTGAFVALKKGTDGLLHVSNVGPGRVTHIEDVIQRGDILDALVGGGDRRGRIGLKSSRSTRRQPGLPEESSSGRRTPRRASPRGASASTAAVAAAAGAAVTPRGARVE